MKNEIQTPWEDSDPLGAIVFNIHISPAPMMFNKFAKARYGNHVNFFELIVSHGMSINKILQTTILILMYLMV